MPSSKKPSPDPAQDPYLNKTPADYELDGALYHLDRRAEQRRQKAQPPEPEPPKQ